MRKIFLLGAMNLILGAVSFGEAAAQVLLDEVVFACVITDPRTCCVSLPLNTTTVAPSGWCNNSLPMKGAAGRW